MKPDWKDAPEWAQWLAMDKDGAWCWFSKKPEQGSYEWHAPMGTSRWLRVEPKPLTDWGTTLEKRPAETGEVKSP